MCRIDPTGADCTPAEGITTVMPVAPVPGCVVMVRVGKKAAGRLLDGTVHDAYPTA